MTDQQQAIKYLRDIGKCASKSQDGHLCTLTANHQPAIHKAQIMGGIEDGKTLCEWPW